MPFSKNITGYENENQIRTYLHGRQVKKVHPIFLDFLFHIYKNIDDKDFIYCYSNYNKEKEDLVIIIHGIKKRISVKMGICNSVHSEPIFQFVKFLREEGLEEEYIKGILRYHFADGTMDGHGSYRMTVKEYKEQHQSEIDRINKRINQDQQLLKKSINRFLFQGRIGENEIDAVIYGVDNDFLFATKEEILELFLEKANDYATGIHFSRLFYQPEQRGLKKSNWQDKRRYRSQIKWYSIFPDILEIMIKRKNKNPYRNKDWTHNDGGDRGI